MLKDISKVTSFPKVLEFIEESSKIAPKSSSEDIETLNYKELSGRLIINKEYQRNFIQTIESASSYIESIFLGLIIPEIQVYEDYNTGEREIIDGQQRVLSLLKYFRNEYKLKGLKEFPQLNGLYYAELPNELKNIIKSFQVNIRVFTNTDDLYKYVIFERLNTGTKKLTAQEVRNCVYRSKFLNMAKELAEVEDVKQLFIGVHNERYQRVEQVLNVMSLIYLHNNEEHRQFLHSDSMTKRINRFMHIARDFNDNTIKNMEENFLMLSNFISSNFNINHIMHMMYPDYPNYSVCKTLCESLYIGFDSYNLKECDKNIDKLRTNIYKVFLSDDYKEALGKGKTKYISVINQRRELIKNAVDEVLNTNDIAKVNI